MEENDFNKRPSSGPIISSPYLNFDPRILNPSGSSQFIIPEGQGETRGKMELAFFTIGTAVTLGGMFGGVNGTLYGIKETKDLKGNVRYSQILNFATKRGSVSAQSFGSIALMFSLYDTFLSYGRDVDDELNIATAGFLTGITYASPKADLKRMAKGGLVGLGLTLAYLSYTKREFLMSHFASSSSNKH